MAPSNGGARKRFVSQTSVLSQPDLLSPEELFSQYTINEIQRNHKKIQRDIESKKSELRTMVGERYRELIDTADTIAAMENTVKSIQSTLDSIQNSCKLERLTSYEEEEEANKKEEFWSIASQMKLLVDTPEKIWNAMENKSFLVAGQLYLLSRHIVTNLEIGGGAGVSQHLTKFPVLPQQWGAISHFKPSILQGCRDALSTVRLSDEQFIESICTIILLEGSDLADLLREILNSRLNSIKTVLTTGSRVRMQLADCVESITCTVQLFYNNVISTNAVLDKLNYLCNNVTTMEIVSAAFQSEAGLQSITRHLPKLVLSYTPTVESSLEIPDTVSLIKDWVESVTVILRDTLPTTLHFVNSVSSVANLIKPYCQRSSSEWETVCQATVNRHVSIWEDMLLGPVNQHVKTIVSSYIRDAMTTTNSDISCVIRDAAADVDVSEFLWNLKNKKEGKLQQRAEGFVDSVQKICCDLNDRLTAIYKDIICYTGAPERSRHKEGSMVRSEEIFAHIHEETANQLACITEHLTGVLPDDLSSSPEAPDQLSLLIQICRCLVYHTPQLLFLLTPHDKGKFSRTATQLYACVEQAKCVLLGRYGAWLTDVLSQQLALLLAADPLMFTTVWEETTIKEEDEAGGSVESKISLPIYASSFVTTLLYALSNELYRAGTHGYRTDEIALMLGSLNEKIVQVYEEWLETADVSQNMALQFWLDFKYLTDMCNVALNTETNKKITTVARRLENFIDPFDWDVFQPHLSSNAQGLIRRTHNLYGAVAGHSVTVQAMIRTSSKTAIQQNTHNILVVNEMAGRFPLLPVRAPDPVSGDSEVSSTLSNLSSLCRTMKHFTSPIEGL